MKNVRRLVIVSLAWGIVSGARVSRDLRNGWLLANSDEDIRL